MRWLVRTYLTVGNRPAGLEGSQLELRHGPPEIWAWGLLVCCGDGPGAAALRQDGDAEPCCDKGAGRGVFQARSPEVPTARRDPPVPQVLRTSALFLPPVTPGPLTSMPPTCRTPTAMHHLPSNRAKPRLRSEARRHLGISTFHSFLPPTPFEKYANATTPGLDPTPLSGWRILDLQPSQSLCRVLVTNSSNSDRELKLASKRVKSR